MYYSTILTTGAGLLFWAIGLVFMKTRTKPFQKHRSIFSTTGLRQQSRRIIAGLAVLLAGVLLGGSAPAAQIVWTNTAGGYWNIAANWNPNQVPTSADDAVIAASGNYTVTLNVSTNIGSLALGGAGGQQTLVNNGYTLTLNQASVISTNGVFLFNSGGLAGTGLLTIQGQFIWTYGAINAGCVVTVATNGLLTLTGGSPHSLYGIMTNTGTIQLLNGSGDLVLNGSCQAAGAIGELVNLPGALVDVQGNSSITWQCGTELVVNQGVLRKSGGAGTTTIRPTFNNSGTLDVQIGTVSLYAGQGSGVFLPEAGATLIFYATYEVDNNLTGAGTNLLNNGTFTLNGDMDCSNVVLNGASLLASNTVINGALIWNYGNINAGSVVTVATNGLLTLASGWHNFYGIMTNAGTIRLLNDGGDLVLYGSCNPGAIGELVNLPGALVDVQGNNSISYNCNTTELVVNQGVVRKSGGTGTTIIYPVFANSGTLDVQTGAVSLNHGQGSGLFLPEAGATLIFSATYEVDNDLMGAGTNLLNGGTFTLNGNMNGSNAVLNGASLLASNAVINGTLTWNSGGINAGSVLTVATNALLMLAGGGGHALYGTITNAGTIQLLTSGGNLNLYGSCNPGAIGKLVNLPGALVDMQGNNAISYNCNTTELVINQGVVRKSGGAGATTISARFNNTGTLDVQTGTVSLYTGQGSGVFLPEAGATLIFSATYEVDSNLTGAGTNLLNSGTFTLNGNMNGSNVVLNGASLLASNTVINGGLTWNSGAINAGSVVTLASNRSLVLAGGGGHSLYGVMTNAGTIQLLNGGGNLTFYGSCQGGGAIGELVNLPGALVDMQGDNSIYIGCGMELVINQGVVRKSGGTGTTTINPVFNSSGTLDVQTGTVNLNNTGRGSGLFLPEAGATLIFSAAYEVDNNLTGAGTNLLNNGTFTLNGNMNGSNVVLNGAGLLASNTVINGGLVWNSGAINAGSVVTVATNRLLVVGSGNGHYLYGTLTNAGTIQLLNGGANLSLYGSCYPGAIGALVNLPGALVDVQGDDSITAGCGTEPLINQGFLRKSGGTGTTAINVLFTNNGTLEVQTGTVSLNRNGQGSGLFLPEAGATLIFSATYEVDSDLAGTGTNLLNGGTFTLNGNINGSNVVLNGANLLASNTLINSTLTWNSGAVNAGSAVTVATNGLLLLASGSGHALYGIVTNAGTIKLLNGGGDLNLRGSCNPGAIGELVNLPGALVDVQGDNSIAWQCTTELVLNQGVLRKSGGTNTTIIQPTFNNSGTVQANIGTVSFGNAFIQKAGQTVLNGGNLAFSQVAQLLGGTLAGTGKITGSVSNNATICTGPSPGLLTISGNYSEGPNRASGRQTGRLPGRHQLRSIVHQRQRRAGGHARCFLLERLHPRRSAVSSPCSPATPAPAIFPPSPPRPTPPPPFIPPRPSWLNPAIPRRSRNSRCPRNRSPVTLSLVKGSGTDLDGTITNLTLLVGTNVLVSAPGSPAQVSFSSDFPGTLTFTAVATDNQGAQGATNATVTITTLPLLNLDAVGFQTNLAFKLCMLGVAGTNYQVLVSTNLAVPGWTPLGTMENTNGIWRFLDPAATNSHRFYQAKQLP